MIKSIAAIVNKLGAGCSFKEDDDLLGHLEVGLWPLLKDLKN